MDCSCQLLVHSKNANNQEMDVENKQPIIYISDGTVKEHFEL
jgi:hypothetical protein